MNKLLKKQKLHKTSWTDYKHQNNICIFIKIINKVFAKKQHNIIFQKKINKTN